MDRVWTWPNIITVARLFFGVYWLYLATLPNSFFVGIMMFVLCGLLPDVIDGWLARTFNQKTRFGEFLDPFADKILFYLAILLLFSENVWWSVFILLACDIASTFLHFFKSGGAVKSGKQKFFLQNCALGVFIFAKITESNIAFVFANFVLICATFFALHSLWSRLRR
ncbi:MAG: hypothetical protein CR972_03865 [Candidatus Moraniibacteriota bacterium]|nr:MAG: hypothetical protein CR972_03865 [Candidatus Moranbacteria bacterium]